MKTPEEYLGKVNSLTLRSELYKIGAKMQKDAWNEAIDVITENTNTLFNKVIKQSIINLKK